MAATEPPDPRNLDSWEDAFQHPIPAVRGMEKKLRNGVNENQEKLKNLVSVSYRDLLGTARTIIEADKQMQNVEKVLVGVGKRCDSRIIDKIAANHSKLENYNASQQSEQNALASQLFVLQKCLAVVGRLLRTNGSTLLTAKLLVVTRLLHKTVSSLTDASVVGETFGNRLVALRQKLLRHIDRRFKRSYGETAALVEDMTAFSLATSSSPSDVLRHFQHLRLEVIKNPLQNENANVKASILKRLQIFLDTQRETRSIYSELLQASLKTLSSRTLLEDPDVRAIDELGLDNHLPWLSSEVKYFTPWTRHEELQKSKASQSLALWAKEGLKALIRLLSDDIRRESDMEHLVPMRAELLQLWLSNRHHNSGLSSREVLREIRSQFNTRFTELIKDSFDELHANTRGLVSESLRSWKGNAESPSSLWDTSTLSMEIANGASSFREAVSSQRSGRSGGIKKILQTFEAGEKKIQTLHGVIKQMRDTKWDDDQDFSGGEDGDYDAPSTYHVLSRDDPDRVQEALREKAVSFARILEEFLTREISNDDLDCSSSSAPGLYVLRLIRELRHRIPLLLQNIDKEVAQRLICTSLVSQLHVSLAATIATKSSLTFSTALGKYASSNVNVRSLWEGTSPPLPIQITPATFKSVRYTVKDMQAMGPDLWTPGAVEALHGALREVFGKSLADVVAKLDEAKYSSANGTMANGVPPEEKGHADEDSKSNDTDAVENNINTEAVETDSQTEEDTNPIAAKSGETNHASQETPIADPLSDETRKEIVKAKATQLLFDAVYLSNALSSAGSATAQAETGQSKAPRDSLAEAITALADKAGLGGGDNASGGPPAATRARLNKSAAEYWRKTNGAVCQSQGANSVGPAPRPVPSPPPRGFNTYSRYDYALALDAQ